MLDRRVHLQPLGRGLFAGDDQVHVIAAAQAMVGDGEQCIRVRRQIDAHHLSFFIHHMIDKSRVLMTEAVVILAPYMRGKQIV